MTHMFTVYCRTTIIIRPFLYLAHVEGEAEEDQVQGASLHQHTGVLD